MKRVKLILCFAALIQSAVLFAQSTIDIDGGKVEKSVSRYTKVVDGKRVPSARVIFQTPLELTFSVDRETLDDENIIKDKLLNGLNEYTVVFYLSTEGANSKTINISANGYSKYTIKDLALKAKESYEYYVFDPSAEKKITRVIKRRDESKHLSQGHKFFAAKEYDKALLEYDKAIAINLLSDSAYYGKGQVYLAQKLYEETYQNYKMVLSINDDFSEIYNDIIRFNVYELGTKRTGSTKYSYSAYAKARTQNNTPIDNKVLLGSMSDRDYAIRCYKEALRENDENVDAYYMLIYSYVENVAYELAAQTFADYIARTDLKSNLVASKMLSGVNSAATSRNKPLQKKMAECYIEVYKKAVAKYPQNIDFVDKLAALYAVQRGCSEMDNATKMASYRESIKLYLKIIELAKPISDTSRIAKCYKLLANYYGLLNEPEQARKYEDLQKQIEAQMQIIKDQKDNDEYQVVINHLQSTTSIDSRGAKPYISMGQKCIAKGDIEQGIEIFKALISITSELSKDIGEALFPKQASFDRSSPKEKQAMYIGVSVFEYALSKYPKDYITNLYAARFYYRKGMNKESIAAYEVAISIAEELNNKKELGSLYNTVAYIYSWSGDKKTAEKYFKKAKKYL